MTRKEIVVTLTGPDGVKLDITRRVKLGGIGTITEGAEEEILELTHGDMNLTLDDRDRQMRALFDNSETSDRWELVILTETGRAQGLKWDRLFAGVLDLPWSVSSDLNEDEVTLQVFSYTKALEQIPATAVSRTVTGRTITITAGSKSATANSTTDLQRGDQVTARSASVEEQMVVDRVTSATAFTVKEIAGNAFTDANLTLDTYFLREKSPAYLAGAILDVAAVSSRSIDLSRDLAAFPLAQPIALHGVGLTARPISLVQQAGKIVATFNSADETKRKQTTGPTASFTDGATSNNYQADWRPYLLTEPGTIRDRAQGADVPIQSDSNPQGPNTPLPRYVAECVAYTAGVDTSVGDRWQLYADQHIVLSTQYTRLSLYKNGVSVKVIEDIANGSAGQFQVFHGWIEWDSFNNLPWFSYQVIPYLGTTPTIRQLGYYNGTPFFTFQYTDNARSGQLRFCRGLGSSGHMLFYDCPISLNTGMAESGTLRMFNSANALVVAGWGLDATIPFTSSFPLLWTARAWSSFLALFHTKADGTYISIWQQSALVKLAEYRVSSKRELTGFLTAFDLPDGRTVGVGFAGGEWFVLSPRLDGVIPYADFAGKSCAGALKELAIASVAYLDADRYNTISLIQRPALLSAAAVQTLTDPLDRTSIPIWEFYRTACKVSGTDATGGSFAITQGADGGSAKTLDVQSPLITTAGMALAVAQFYAAYLNRKVRQENIRIKEPDEPVRVLDIVNFDDRKWLATQVEHDTSNREQTVRLFEVR